MKKMTTKVLSLVTALIMAISVFSISAFATVTPYITAHPTGLWRDGVNTFFSAILHWIIAVFDIATII